MSRRKFSPNSAGTDFFSSNSSSTHVYSAYKSRKDISTRKFRHLLGRESGKLPFLEAWARSYPDKNNTISRKFVRTKIEDFRNFRP
jgi:hypothetical protein